MHNPFDPHHDEILGRNWMPPAGPTGAAKLSPRWKYGLATLAVVAAAVIGAFGGWLFL